MAIDQDTVRRIAALARLKLDEGQIPALESELNAMLAWVEQLQEVDCTGVEPMTSVVAQAPKMREDVVTDGGYPDDIVKNAPLAEGHFFVVPKVVE